jgi:hypothetical protein
MVNGGWLEVKVVITFECLFNHRAYCLNSNFKELGECTEFKTPKVILPIPKIRLIRVQTANFSVLLQPV